MAFLYDGASTINNVRTVHGSPYTFSVKPKWRTVFFWFFAARSSAEAYFRLSPPRGHSTVGVPKRCEGFVAIWPRAREDIAHNRFQLLFIYVAVEVRNQKLCNATNLRKWRRNFRNVIDRSVMRWLRYDWQKRPCLTLFQLPIGVCLKSAQASTAKNHLETRRYVGGVAAQPHVRCF